MPPSSIKVAHKGVKKAKERAKFPTTLEKLKKRLPFDPPAPLSVIAPAAKAVHVATQALRLLTKPEQFPNIKIWEHKGPDFYDGKNKKSISAEKKDEKRDTWTNVKIFWSESPDAPSLHDFRVSVDCSDEDDCPWTRTQDLAFQAQACLDTEGSYTLTEETVKHSQELEKLADFFQNTVVIVVEGGGVQDVLGLPEGFNYEILDHDD